jgi:multicomponent Na+:H+ antiporter subunit E
MRATGKVGSFLYLLVFLGAAWLCLTSTFGLQELVAGIVVCCLLALWLAASYSRLGLPPLGLSRIFYFVVYLLVLLKEIVKANIDVAYRVLHPRMPIRPGIVAIRTNLKQDVAKLILANSITLTPGTFTVDIIEDTLLIHWINVRAEDSETATRMIGQKFEKYLAKVFA